MPRPARFVPAFQPIDAYRGDDLDIPWTFTRTIDGVKTLRDVSNWVITGQVRYSPDVEPALGDFTIDASMSASGLIIMSLSRAQTQILPPQMLRWDMQRIVNDKMRTIVGGPFNVDPDITRP